MKRAIAITFAAVALLAAVTYAALETDGVAIAETRKADGSMRSTHVWFVRDADELLVEAGSASNGWFVDIQQSGELSLTIDHRPLRYTTRISLDPARQKRLRSLLRAKYGWRDWWVSLFVDQHQTIPVLLIPQATPRTTQETARSATR